MGFGYVIAFSDCIAHAHWNRSPLSVCERFAKRHERAFVSASAPVRHIDMTTSLPLVCK